MRPASGLASTAFKRREHDRDPALHVGDAGAVEHLPGSSQVSDWNG